MKKSTLVRVTTDNRHSDDRRKTIYISDGCHTAWITSEDLPYDFLLREAFSALLKEVQDEGGCFGYVVDESCLFDKVREYRLIRIILLLGWARLRHHYCSEVEFGILPKVVGRPRSTSVRNLMRLTYQTPSMPGEPLREVRLG